MCSACRRRSALTTSFPSKTLRASVTAPRCLDRQSYNGVAIIARQECADAQRGNYQDQEGAHARLLAATLDGVRLVNVYVPNGQAVGSEKFAFKLDWMKRLREFFDNHYQTDAPVVLCGDFNVAPEDRDVHLTRHSGRSASCAAAPNAARSITIKRWGFTDTFRLHHEEGGQFSWWDYRAGAFRRNMGLRIDHLWVSKPLVARSKNTWIDIEPRTWERPSDHAPVVAEFE